MIDVCFFCQIAENFGRFIQKGEKFPQQIRPSLGLKPRFSLRFLRRRLIQAAALRGQHPLGRDLNDGNDHLSTVEGGPGGSPG